MENYGLMVNTAINQAMVNKEIIIYPYNKDNLTPVGYDLSFSKLIISLRKKNLVSLKYDKREKEFYFWLHPNETVLVLTKETVCVSNFIGGTLHSKVSFIAKGLDHISTTLDPGWQGQLLIPINNPTNRKIKIIPIKEGIEQAFLTLVFFKSQVEALVDTEKTKPARIEILKDIIESNKNIIIKRTRSYKLLKDLIQKISDVYANKNQVRFSIDSHGDNYDNYINQQKDLNDALNNQYDKVNKVVIGLARNKTLLYWLLVIFVLICLCGLCLLANTIVDETILILLIPVITAFSLFTLQNIKNRFL